MLSSAALFSTALTGMIQVGKTMIGLLFGPDYVSAYSELIIVTIAQLASGFFGMNASVLDMGGLKDGPALHSPYQSA